MLNSFKSYIKRKIVRKKIVPIVIKDIESNLLVGKKAFITGGSSGIGCNHSIFRLDISC